MEPQPAQFGPDDGVGWVVHIVVDAVSLDQAFTLAHSVADRLSGMPKVDLSQTTLSQEDHQNRRWRVFCARTILDGPGHRQRCLLPYDHTGACSPVGATVGRPPQTPGLPPGSTNPSEQKGKSHGA